MTKKKEHDKEIQEAKMLAEEYKDNMQRIQAEFENFQKRTEKEIHAFRGMANAGIIEEFLPLVDSLGEGIKQAEKSNNEEMKKGFELVQKQLTQIMEKNGVKQIESIGKKFDHNFHECMLTVNEQGKDDEILEEFQKGYTLNGKILRPAKVKVNKKE
ncbi:MAG: nucleotide exchange factor GrpE [Candidatus Diapherotrites archaeon]|uniref:Nucleotide exchange factor GrpE n=1 Tax=Candidatus Iainarchaeum sp. TaxID=3101447 RepID=A0A2D6LP76_9ARCH|nr:nucleotide exchange factor GrpE [Candidatus Diapherotrites archaeon]